MALTITAWGADVTGRAVRNNNPNQPVAQCTELWRDFLVRVVEAPHNAGYAPNGHAYSLWTQFGQAGSSNDNTIAPTHLERIPRSQGGQRGDAVIWNANVPGVTEGDGHVAVLNEDLGDSVAVWSQNDKSAPGRTRFGELTSTGILGFLRPKKFITTPEKEENMYQIIENDGKHYFCSGAGVALIESLTHRQNLEQALLVMKIRDSIKPEGGMGQTARETLTYYTAKARA